MLHSHKQPQTLSAVHTRSTNGNSLSHPHILCAAVALLPTQTASPNTTTATDLLRPDQNTAQSLMDSKNRGECCVLSWRGVPSRERERKGGREGRGDRQRKQLHIYTHQILTDSKLLHNSHLQAPGLTSTCLKRAPLEQQLAMAARQQSVATSAAWPALLRPAC